MKIKNILLFIILCFSISAYSQTFKAGAIIGLNASQILGDDSAGFNKLGVVGGLRGVVILTDKMEASLELLYSQRGSFQQATINNPDEIRINTDYIDVPVIFNYLDWKGEDYYRLHFHAGFSYGRLINATIQNEKVDPILEEFSENNFSWLGGFTYYVNRHLGLTARYTRSINLLFDNSKSSINSRSYLGFFLTFQGVYMF